MTISTKNLAQLPSPLSALPGAARTSYIASAKKPSSIPVGEPGASKAGQVPLPFVTHPITLEQQKALEGAAQKSVVLVTSERFDGTAIGTGVIVGEVADKWVIATAAHVAEPLVKDSVRRVNVQIAGSLPVEALAFAAPLPGNQYASDLAFAVVPKSLLPGKAAVPVAAAALQRAQASSKPFAVGTELLQAGYPGDQRGVVLERGRPLVQNEKLVGNWVRITEFRPVFAGQGQKALSATLPYSKGQGLGTTRSLSHGSSGGPLFGVENGRVVLFGITSIEASQTPVREGMGGAVTPSRTHSATRAFHMGADFIQPSLQEFLPLAERLQILVRP